MKTAVVTGAGGFIGSFLSKKLLEMNWKVVGIDNFSNVPNGRLEFLFADTECPVVRGDATEAEFLLKTLDSLGGCDYFFDLAYINGTKQFYERPIEILHHAGRHVPAVYEAIKNVKARWIYFSTPEIYGEPESLPTPETHPAIVRDLKNPRWSYSIGKIFSENYIHSLKVHDRQMDYVIIRPNNAFGETDRYHVISDFMDRIYRQEPIGAQGSGAETRTFCYIDDIVSQIIQIALNAPTGEVYNIGSKDHVSIQTLLNDIMDVTGSKVDSAFSSQLQKGSPTRRQPDIRKVLELGYSPAWTLRDGLERTWAEEQRFRQFLKSL
jgi:nucleoside-diphosphate-sugar epimerase